jgi:hypothetical protein
VIKRAIANISGQNLLTSWGIYQIDMTSAGELFSLVGEIEPGSLKAKLPELRGGGGCDEGLGFSISKQVLPLAVALGSAKVSSITFQCSGSYCLYLKLTQIEMISGR